MKERKVAVLAGTPVDTAMGVEYIKNKNSETEGQCLLPLSDPVSVDCDAQVRFQYSDEDGKRAVMDNIFDAEIAEGVRDYFVYCNSLSGSFDFDTYAVMKSLDSGEDIRIYTPLQVYRSLGGEYGRIGVMAANNLSAHAIEEALMAANPDIYMIGTGNMAIVRAIEDGLEPEEIIEKCGLRHMLKYMEACGAEAIVLGCTHFPYFRDELAGLTDLPVIDPADKMFEALLSADC
ncbi:MAG: aspartate/glutamate racemase family protein [Mogibacterium sp.]|nr:aspartate/glutamate racemase family protein [Mogibacterium sp.]MBR2390641.1 aspartate/glutamate racemase family protein [Mogibacterium sp.]MBR3331521.1 aspartate/glutamate racemase family protein [Mogibacterium sp.]MBR4089431.1 aspartate/glutamate racemase family protein [Mogibacterium sp.]